MLASVFQSGGRGGRGGRRAAGNGAVRAAGSRRRQTEPLLWSLLPLRSCFQAPLGPSQGLCLLQASQAVLGQGAQGTC